jgi:regulator of replication initiation timing
MSKAEDDSFIHFLEESMEKVLNGVKYVYIQRLELRQELKTLRAENDKLREKLLEIDQPRWQYARNVEAKKIHHIGDKMILEGDKYQEFIDPDLLNNGDGSID